jgi:shikimate kinase / 3-dehydroquinate synthase
MEALRARGAIVFVGFMGAGKSTSARAVADELRAAALDSDSELENELGEPLEQFFEREGEAAFREREEQVVLRLLARGDAQVVALGGGALGSARVREALRAHTVVHLEVDPAEAWRRCRRGGRPLARERSSFDRLHRERAALYDAVADATLPASSTRDSVRRALAPLLALRGEARGARLLWAVSASAEHPVFLGRGLIHRGFVWPQEARRYVVTDENVNRLYQVPAEARIVIGAGEEQKTMSGAERALRELAQAGARRGDVVVGVGGGVVGDLAGFCAAVYQRGTPHVQVPTTLVAQVDSAYGGKTGVDLPEAKNFVGAYHHPAAVICDPTALDTLPGEELAAGYAEVVKTALIAGGPLWERVRRGDDVDDEVIRGCIRTKLAVVAEDERDAGARQVLNLGHTVAHAIEAATGYRRYRHGEAVAVGLLCALRLSGQEDLRSEVAGLLSARGLPLRFEGPTPDEVVTITQRDKKRTAEGVPFVLVEGPGQVTPGHTIDPDTVRAAVREAFEG